MKTKWKIVLAVLILLAAGGAAFSLVMQEKEVEVKKAALSDIKRSFTEEGVVVPLSERSVYSLYSARVEKLLVKEGEQVSEGQLVAVLDDSELQYKLRELEARLKGLDAEKLRLDEVPGPAELESYRLRIEEAESDLERARENYERIKGLHEQGAVATVELEGAEELLSRAEYNLAQQEKALQILEEAYSPPLGSREVIEAQEKAILAQIGLLKHQQKNYRLSAPISGVVTAVDTEEGELAAPQVPLLTLFLEEDHRIEAKVLTRDIYDIYTGMPVNLLLRMRDEEIVFPGEVIKISPYAQKDISPLGLEEERVKVTILPLLPEDLKIAPGYGLDVEFVTEELSGVLVVPKTALFSYQGEDALLVVENNRAQIRPVKTGLETRHEIVITEGLEEGDLVVLDPQTRGVDEGTRVKNLGTQ